MKDVSDEDIALFAQYYYRNHGAARQALEVVDAKEEPTFADYAMAAGLTAFVGEFRSKEAPDLSKVNEKPESLEKVQQAVQDIDQMKLAQERLQALEAERLILRNQVAEIADKYQLAPEELDVGHLLNRLSNNLNASSIQMLLQRSWKLVFRKPSLANSFRSMWSINPQRSNGLPKRKIIPMMHRLNLTSLMIHISRPWTNRQLNWKMNQRLN